MQVLAIDIGGTNVKLLRTGDSERRKFPSGPNLTPKRFAKAIKVATEGWSYDAVTVGLPAPIADGRPLIDPVNLGAGWTEFDFGALFSGVPFILANDAELQALGSWPGEGKMLYTRTGDRSRKRHGPPGQVWTSGGGSNGIGSLALPGRQDV